MSGSSLSRLRASLRASWAAARTRVQQLSRSPRARRIAAILAAALLVYALLGFLAAPPLLRNYLQNHSTETLGRPLSLGQVRFNPFTLNLRVGKLHLPEADGQTPFVDIDQLTLNASWSSLFHLAPVLDELRLDQPRIAITRGKDQRFNFTDLIERFTAKPSPAGSQPARFSLSNISVHGGDIRFDDQLLGAQHHIEKLELGIPFLANLPSSTDIFVQPLLAMTVDGSALRIDGQAKPFASSRESTIGFQLDRLDLPRYLGYVPAPMPVAIPKGLLSGKLSLHFVQTQPTPQLQLTGNLQVDDLALDSSRGDAIARLGHGNIELVDPFDRDILLRRTLITQSMYMLAAGSTFVYVWSFYKPTWDRWLLMGVTLLGAYGIYELLFFALTGFNGDILTNRRFGSSSGSAFQTIAIGPLIMERLKSLTGEPSMYAFTVLPFCIYAWHVRHRGIAAFLLLTLLLSTSTTAVIGLAVYLLLRLAFYGPTDRPALFFGTALLVLLLLGLAGNQYINDAYIKIVGEKLQSASGESRLLSFQVNLDYFAQEPLLTKIFGIGFGYARATNMFATLLINLGVLGVLLTTAVFMIPVFRLGPSERERGLKAAVLVIFVTMMGSVPEFSYLSIWVFLGMAYHALGRRKREQGPALDLSPGLQT